MTIRTAEQAAELARKKKTNVVNSCQTTTRRYYDAPAAGDQDGDGDADAVDGWLSETKRHPGDRNPPLGFPVAFKGGSKGFGHRAISLGGGKIRSTDYDTNSKRFKAGIVGTGTIENVERALGVTYLGWSETIDGIKIPTARATTTTAKKTAKATAAKTAAPSVPRQHTRIVNGVNNDSTLNLDEISAVQRTGIAPYAKAADKLHDAILAAWSAYLTATRPR